MIKIGQNRPKYRVLPQKPAIYAWELCDKTRQKRHKMGILGHNQVYFTAYGIFKQAMIMPAQYIVLACKLQALNVVNTYSLTFLDRNASKITPIVSLLEPRYVL